MTSKSCKALLLTVALMAAASAAGCGGTTPEGFKKIKYGGILPGSPKPFEVKITIDRESWSRAYGGMLPSLEVDLVGVNAGEKAAWENYPVSKYFTPNDPWRRDADRATKTFASNDRDDKVLSRYDPNWGEWIGRSFGSGQSGKGAQWLFVIANIPGVTEDLPGAQDPRRIILPLKGSDWPFRTSEIEIVIKSSMAVCTTPTKAKK